jgi:hypothetical protein
MIASFDIGEKNFAYAIGNRETILVWKRVDIIKFKNQTIIQSCVEINKILTEENWNECVKVIIEQQMRSNCRAQRISQHVWSWFSILYPHLDPIFVPSYLKTRYFIGKNNLSSKERKKWAVNKTIELLKGNDSANLLFSEKKKDDMADCYLQLLAYLKIENPLTKAIN